MTRDPNDIFRAGNTAHDAIQMLQAWNRLLDLLPPKHHLMMTGPWGDGHLVVHVIDQQKSPGHAILRVRGDTVTRAFELAHDTLRGELDNGNKEAAVARSAVTGTNKRSTKNKTTERDKAVADALTKLDSVVAAMGASQAMQPGFTRDRDLVAHLVWKNGRVSQYELRHQFGIKNPAQAINDAEAHYHFTMETGGALPNGDIPYRLVGAAPAVEGTLPMFVTGIEDPDEKLYVLELDLYSCVECGRHPVYRPQRIEGGYSGVCPRHGPATFRRL